VVSPGHTKGSRLRFLGFSTNSCAGSQAPPLAIVLAHLSGVPTSVRVGAWDLMAGDVACPYGACGGVCVDIGACACVPVSPLSVDGLTVGA